MTTHQEIAPRQLSLLELAFDFGNVCNACTVIGYSRRQFYEIRHLQAAGAADDYLAGPMANATLTRLAA